MPLQLISGERKQVTVMFADVVRSMELTRALGAERWREVLGAAGNLQWRNPLGFMQQDAYLQRGRRVYWVSVVRPRSEAVSSARGRQEAFALVDDMACRLSFCQ